MMRGPLTDMGAEVATRPVAATGDAGRALHDIVDESSGFAVRSAELTGWTGDNMKVAFNSLDVRVERLSSPSGEIHVFAMPTQAGDIDKLRKWLSTTDPVKSRQFGYLWPTTLVETRKAVRVEEGPVKQALWCDVDSDDLPVFVMSHGNSTCFGADVQETSGTPAVLGMYPHEQFPSNDISTEGPRFGQMIVALRDEIGAVARGPHSPLFGESGSMGRIRLQALRKTSPTALPRVAYGTERVGYRSSSVVRGPFCFPNTGVDHEARNAPAHHYRHDRDRPRRRSGHGCLR